jgi:hypothetical protein
VLDKNPKTRLIHKRDLGSILRDVSTNKTPQTKKGGFKAAWRMSVHPQPCNNGGGGGKFSKAKRFVAKWIGTQKQ